MERPRPASLAWGALVTGIVAYDVLCPAGETLSEGVDRALEHDKGKIIALGIIGITAAHLANLLPERIDPFHRATLLKRAVRAIVEEPPA